MQVELYAALSLVDPSSKAQPIPPLMLPCLQQERKRE